MRLGEGLQLSGELERSDRLVLLPQLEAGFAQGHVGESILIVQFQSPSCYPVRLGMCHPNE